MLNMVPKCFWPALFQELKARREEVRMIALEEIERQEAEKQEIERRQNVEPPFDKWHRRGRPPGVKKMNTSDKVEKKAMRPKLSSKKIKSKQK